MKKLSRTDAAAQARRLQARVRIDRVGTSSVARKATRSNGGELRGFSKVTNPELKELLRAIFY